MYGEQTNVDESFSVIMSPSINIVPEYEGIFWLNPYTTIKTMNRYFFIINVNLSKRNNNKK